ncbi:hypothetical protein INT43_000782 [Umbelopsis isabellina]|uniref:Uncharacterized protein n=1 Tax=Mortierella isabellina TaxID=91625 RepID=A0A8H7UN33_MORIS|nr:hypothetical protein INT43_000782 [Umbelopsis isabellina]
MKRKSGNRSAMRKEQSQRDKIKALADRSTQFSVYRQFLEHVKNTGMEGEHTKIPLDLIDLTATLIATMISGHSYLKFFIAPTIGLENGYFDIMEDLKSDINFIRKTLNMARISCTSLVVSLWYVDKFFHHKSKRHLRARKLDDSFNSSLRPNPAEGWSTRDLFMASIVTADKYLADVTWSNAEWAVNTGGYYTCDAINRLERQFLRQMDFNLFVTDEQYRHFCNYLEVSLHLRQVVQYSGSSLFSLSYQDVSVLSQSLLPVYAERLKLSLRPFEAIVLLAKMVALTFAIYLATLVTLAAAAYIIHIQAELIRQHLVSTLYSQMHTMCEYLVASYAHTFRTTGTNGVVVQSLPM